MAPRSANSSSALAIGITGAVTLLSLCGVPAAAQRPVPRQAAASSTAARPTGSPVGCALETPGGIHLRFESCAVSAGSESVVGAGTGASARAKEIEVVEYRNGDSPHRQVVVIGGRTQGQLSARRLGTHASRANLGMTGPDSIVLQDSDEDGVAERRLGGRMKVGRVTLSRSAALAPDDGAFVILASGSSGGDAMLEQWSRAGARDGRPVAVRFVAPDGSALTAELERCVPQRFTREAADAAGGARSELLLRCALPRVSGEGSSAPMARFLTGSADAAEGATMRNDGAGARNPETAELHGARVESWSVEYLPGNRKAPHRWTLEVRVERIEAQ